MKPRTLAAVLVLVLLGASRGVLAGEATDHIRARIDKVYEILDRTGGDASPDRNAAAGKVLAEMFDWNEMGRRSLGRYWGERTPAERTEFVRLFAALFQRTYLSRIELADREKFQYLDEAIEGDTATVKTMVITKKGRQIPVDYLARRAGAQPRRQLSGPVHDPSGPVLVRGSHHEAPRAGRPAPGRRAALGRRHPGGSRRHRLVSERRGRGDRRADRPDRRRRVHAGRPRL